MLSVFKNLPKILICILLFIFSIAIMYHYFRKDILEGFENPDDMVGKRHYELFLKIPERPIDEINDKLNDEGSWQGVIKCPHKSGQDFISKITLKKVDGRDVLLCTCEVVKDK